MLVDVIELKDGRVIGITEDVLVIYANMEDLTNGDSSLERPHIYL